MKKNDPKIFNKIKISILNRESEVLFRTVEKMFFNDQIPELCELIVQLSLRDILNNKETDEIEINIDDFINATKLGIAYLENSTQTKH